MTESAAPLGAEVVSPGAAAPAAASATTPVETPTAIELKEDSLIRVPGVEKPVKFSDHVRGFQSQATKASQRAAELERKYNEAQQALQRHEQNQRQAPQQNQSGTDPLAELRSLPYTSGEQVAQVVQSIAAEINARDQVLLATLKELQKIKQAVGPMYESNQNQQFDSKIGSYLQQGGYPQEYTDLAKELYLAYEPSAELDEEFPRILAARIQQVETAQENKRRQAVEAARRAPFVPGRGTPASPSKPFRLDPRNTARDDADALWEAIHAGSGT